MRETEVKILEINREKVEDALNRMNARKVFDGEMETLFYDFKDGSIVRAKNVMRLRREDEEVVLTYKNVKGDTEAKVAEEYSVVVSDFAVMNKILELLGLFVIESTKKRRTSYEFEGTRFDIDRYLGRYSYIPEFLEIESDSIDSIYKNARALGFKTEDCLPWSTVRVIEFYSAKKDK